MIMPLLLISKKLLKMHQHASGRMTIFLLLLNWLSLILMYLSKLPKVIQRRNWAASPFIKIHVLKYMPSNFVWRVLQSLINISLPDKCLSIYSHVMGIDTPYNKSIASRVQSSYSPPRGETFISSSSSFQTNLSRNITHNRDFYKNNSVFSFFINKAI